MTSCKRIVLLGASGYTGADFLRLGLRHPAIEFVALSADRQAGRAVADLWPHLHGTDLPVLQPVGEIDFIGLKPDALISCLPHATTHTVIAAILDAANHALPFPLIDLSADFRLRNTDSYAAWYGTSHALPSLQPTAVYGLTELYREQIRSASLVACPGCYPTAVLLALIPLVSAGLIDIDDLHIDAKSGVTGAGRGLKQANLFAEVAEALHPYGLGGHRHTPEIEQEIAGAAAVDPATVRVSFIPHLVPINRGELVTISARLAPGATPEAVKSHWLHAYRGEPFIRILADDTAPATRMVRGSNMVVLNSFAARVSGRVILVSAIDNLVKGSSGQALQNFNLMMGLPETTGLEQVALFP